MWYKAILENGGTWEPVSDCYKNQQILEKAVDSETCINICAWLLYNWENVG